MKSEKKICRIWEGNQNGTLYLAIPKALCEKFGLKTGYVILEDTPNGILFKRLDT